MQVSHRITGFDDFNKALKRLTERKARSALQRALNQSTQPMVKQARTNVDREVGRDTGEGRRQIKKRNLKKHERTKLGVDQAVLVFLHDDGFYLRFWEHGFTRNGRHYAARPWFRPAFDSTKDEVVKGYKFHAVRLIEKAAAKR